MVNYVNDDGFLSWYSEKTGSTGFNKAALLQKVFDRYLEDQVPEFILPAGSTVSGAEERYPFRFEDLGCCGASTYFIYFGESAQ
ncbi:MAG: hypothetical protein HUJ65_02585 [Oscillospiraceae bacterium]|nr:hypothetical protein [Oscillospiraceae bacterium]